MRVVNFAHGEMVVVGMYIGWALWKYLGSPTAITVPIATVTMFAVGYLFQRVIGNDFVDKPQHIQFVFYIGLALAITGLSAITFGPDPRGIEAARASQPIRSVRSHRRRAPARGNGRPDARRGSGFLAAFQHDG